MVRNIDAGDACTLAEFAAAEFGLYDDATGIPDWLYELAEEVIETANA